MADKERIIEQIQKMMRLRNDAAASQGEIENATAMVQKLLFKYNLTMGEIESSTADAQYERFFENPPDQKKRESKWILALYNTIAKFNFCTIVTQSRYDNPNDRKHVSYQIAIIGMKQNVEVVTYLCSWLIPKIRQMSNDAWITYSNGFLGHEKRGKFQRGYLLGCVQGIFSKLHEQQRILESESTESTALVRVRGAELQQALHSFYPRLRSGTQMRLSSRDGRGMGYEDGRKIELTRGIETRNRKLLGE